MKPRIFVLGALIGVAACSRGGQFVLPPGSERALASRGVFIADVAARSVAPNSVLFSVFAPGESGVRSVSIALDGGTPQVVELSDGTRDCVTDHGAVQCSLSVAAGAGAHRFDLAAFAGAHGAGGSSWVASNVPLNVDPQGVKLGLALGGNAASVTILAPGRDARVVARADGGVDLFGNAPVLFGAYAKDADGRLLLGKAAPRVTLASAGPLTVSARADDGNTFAVGGNASSPEAVSGTLTARAGELETSLPVTVSQPWIFVAGGGTVRAFDEDGNLKSMPGAFSGLLMPYGIAYDPDNRSLYVLDVVAETVRAFDLQGRERTLAGTFAGLLSADSISFDPKSHLLFVSQAGSATILRCYDSDGRSQPLPASLVALEHAQSVAFRAKKPAAVAVTAQNALLRVDASGTQQSAVTATPDRDRPAGVASDERDDATYVTDSRRGTIVAIDAHGSVRARSAAGRFRPQGVTFDPYTRRVYAADATATFSVAAFDANLRPVSLPTSAFRDVETPHALAVVAR